MELQRQIRAVVDPESPVSPVPVRISDKIINDVHYVISVGVITDDHFFYSRIMMSGIDAGIFHGNDASFCRGDEKTGTDTYAFIFIGLIKDLV